MEEFAIELLLCRAGVGAGKKVAVRSWLRTLNYIRSLPEVV